MTELASKQRERYYRYKAAGICVDCGSAPSNPGQVRCERCRKESNRGVDRYRVRKYRDGICERCSQPRDGDGKLCRACNDKQLRRFREARKQWVADGLCHTCGGPRDEDNNFKNCFFCRARAAADVRYRTRERKKAGVCIRCGRQRDSNRNHCEICRAERRKARGKYVAGLKAQGLCPRCRKATDRPQAYCSACCRRDRERMTGNGADESPEA